MSSLPKRPKDPPPERENAFRLHYFPEIPVDFGAQQRPLPEGECGFHRIDFEAGHETISGLSDDASAGEKDNAVAGNRKLEEVEAQAYSRGFNKGERAGYQAGQEKIEAVLNDLQNMVSQLTKLKKQIYIDSEREIVELVLAIARRIICHEVKLNKSTVIDVAREALKQVEDHEKIKIRLRPEDLECLQSSSDSNPICSNENVIIEAEDTISSGGCVIETDAGAFDARIEKQLQAVEEALRSAYKQVDHKANHILEE